MSNIETLISLVTGIIALFTFLYVTVGGVVIKKSITLNSIGSKPVRFRIQLRNYNIQQLTNIVSALYFEGGQIPDNVRLELIKMTAPTAMKKSIMKPSTKQPSVFVNLTNHPFNTWDEKQQADALKLGNGKIIDIPFPAVNSAFNEKQISIIVNDFEERIQQEVGNQIPIVHIMGEMNFTYAMVKRLREQGVACVASTTERVVEERDGQKVSTFRFVQFRNYE